MREERNKFISFVPLALKDIGLKITKYLLDNKAVSMDFQTTEGSTRRKSCSR